MRTTPTAFVPAHKQTSPEHKPGQVINPLGFTDKTLSDYINRKYKQDAFTHVHSEHNSVKAECCGNPLRGCMDCPPAKKLTFEQWYNDNQIGHLQVVEDHGYLDAYFEACWKAAQENI